jgi:CelD/BcsL family acetyltransferase involved in cellulose biosynthesis
MTNWHTVEYAVLAQDPGTMTELAKNLYTRRQDRIFLSFLDADAEDTAVLERAAREAGYRSRRRLLERSPYVDIDGDWERYLAGRRTKFIANLGRRRRRLQELGHVSVDCFRGGASLDRALDEGFTVEGSGWKLERGTAIVSDPATERFYREIAHWAADRKWLTLWFLRLDGRQIAFEYGIEAGGVQYFVKGGYDPEFKQYSPAQLLVHDVLKACFDGGVRRYEFLGEVEPFKLEWTDSTRGRIALEAFAPTAAGRFDWYARTRLWPVLKRARSFARR